MAERASRRRVSRKEAAVRFSHAVRPSSQSLPPNGQDRGPGRSEMHDDITSARRRLILYRHLRTTTIFVLGISAIAAAESAGAITLPPGFTDELVAAVGSPTALAFTPDGRLLITTQPGQLRVYQNGALVGTPALDLTGAICSNSERGLLGVAVDPNFTTPSNNFIYVYYTFNRAGICVNRVSRYTLSSSNVASGQTVLIDNIP